MRLWDFLQWDTVNYGVGLETSYRDLEDLCTVQRLISMGEPYHLRTMYTGRPIFEPTVGATEEGCRDLSSMTETGRIQMPIRREISPRPNKEAKASEPVVGPREHALAQVPPTSAASTKVVRDSS